MCEQAEYHLFQREKVEVQLPELYHKIGKCMTTAWSVTCILVSLPYPLHPTTFLTKLLSFSVAHFHCALITLSRFHFFWRSSHTFHLTKTPLQLSCCVHGYRSRRDDVVTAGMRHHHRKIWKWHSWVIQGLHEGKREGSSKQGDSENQIQSSDSWLAHFRWCRYLKRERDEIWGGFMEVWFGHAET